MVHPSRAGLGRSLTDSSAPIGQSRSRIACELDAPRISFRAGRHSASLAFNLLITSHYCLITVGLPGGRCFTLCGVLVSCRWVFALKRGGLGWLWWFRSVIGVVGWWGSGSRTLVASSLITPLSPVFGVADPGGDERLDLVPPGLDRFGQGGQFRQVSVVGAPCQEIVPARLIWERTAGSRARASIARSFTLLGFVAYLRGRRGADELLSSVAQGVDGSPLGFYLRLRFSDTGELSTRGRVLRLP